MKCKTLKTFLTLAENGCDFGVHKILCIPRSTMWSHITEIENEINIKLIHRRKKNSTFTSDGFAFIPYAKKIYDTFNESISELSSSNGRTQPHDILISTTRAAADGWLLPSMKLFFEKHHNIHVKIIGDDYLNKQLINSADIFLRPIDDLEGITKKWFIGYEHGLFASTQYLNRMGTPMVPEDLYTHHILGYGEYTFSYFDDINWHLKGKNYNLPKLNSSLTINSTKATYNACCEGLGICSSTDISNTVYEQELIPVLPEIIGPFIKSFFCVRDDIGTHKKENITLFQDFIETYLTKQGVKVNHE